jgi:hypothetical protein
MFLEWCVPVPDNQIYFTAKGSVFGIILLVLLKNIFKGFLMKDSVG